jgi:hypothetical protein
LHVHCRDDINARSQQMLDVLIALAISALWSVGVCQLVDQSHRRFSFENRVHIHLVQGNAVMMGNEWWNDFQIRDFRNRFRALVRLDVADHHIYALPSKAVPFDQHLVSLPDPRTWPQVDLQLPELLAPDNR